MSNNTNGVQKTNSPRMKHTISTFTTRANIVHNNEYSYDNFVYVDSRTKSRITCSTHGDFEKQPNMHLSGQGCPFCSKEKSLKLRTKTKETFVEQANFAHNNKYSYDNFVYVNTMTAGLITCKLHGDFKQAPNSHLNKQGCPICGKNSLIKTKEEFVAQSNRNHNFKYSYDKFVYINARTKGIITCPTHGDFEQTPANHSSKNGCPDCGKASSAKLLTKTKETFVEQANNIHNGKYSYDNFIYINDGKDGLITCKIHGDFKQIPRIHLRGSGCLACHNEFQTKTNEDFVLQAIEIHKGKYSYNNFVYINTATKGRITCSIHGDFMQSPRSHLRGVWMP